MCTALWQGIHQSQLNGCEYFHISSRPSTEQSARQIPHTEGSNWNCSPKPNATNPQLQWDESYPCQRWLTATLGVYDTGGGDRFRLHLPFPLQFSHCSISHPFLTCQRPLLITSASTAFCPLHFVLPMLPLFPLLGFITSSSLCCFHTLFFQTNPIAGVVSQTLSYRF